MAINTWAPLRIACNCVRSFMPPTTTAARMPVARGHLGEGLVDLQREFAGGAQDDGADTGMRGFAGEQVDDGQDKRKRFAGPGLGRGDQVAPGQCGLDSLGLDGSRLIEAVLCEIALQESREREVQRNFSF